MSKIRNTLNRTFHRLSVFESKNNKLEQELKTLKKELLILQIEFDHLFDELEAAKEENEFLKRHLQEGDADKLNVLKLLLKGPEPLKERTVHDNQP